MAQNVALILGYGPITGTGAARAFAAKGYKIAIVSRSRKDSESEKDYLQIQADLSDPSSVEGIFSKVISELGHPSVVIYNGVSLLFHRIMFNDS
jgi:NAD(P)-dependent dehydrogenase (short-subunit alcohol dehydrogenase family)